MATFDDLSPQDLQNLIKDAQAKLEQKQNDMRKEVIGQIKELAASIGIVVEISDDRRLSKNGSPSVKSKYRNPQNPLQEWTGRGLAPRWLRELIAEGHGKDEFLINH